MKITVKDKRTKLEREIDDVLDNLAEVEETKPEYSTILTNLERLYKMKAEDNSSKIKPDTIVMVAGNLLGILLILNFERLNVITTRALGFVIKGRV